MILKKIDKMFFFTLLSTITFALVFVINIGRAEAYNDISSLQNTQSLLSEESLDNSIQFEENNLSGDILKYTSNYEANNTVMPKLRTLNCYRWSEMAVTPEWKEFMFNMASTGSSLNNI